MRDNISKIKDAKADCKAAEETMDEVSMAAIKDEIAHIFAANPHVQNVAWGAKSSEYNDEGMYPGIAGPVFDDDGDEYYPEWLTEYNPTVNPALVDLAEVLKLIGAETLTRLYGDQEIVVATNKVVPQLPQLNFETRSASY